MKYNVKFKKIISALILFLSVAASLLLLSRLTMPKYISKSREGNLISEYYAETDAGNLHEVIFVGDCEAYSSFVPAVLYEKHGIRSFVRGSPSQTVAQSYALISETLDYETPRAIVLSVYSLCREDGSEEAYNRMTLDGMRPSLHKARAVYQSLGEDESLLSYFVPLLRFHSRWSELEKEDIEYLFSRPRVSHNGYYMQKGVLAGDGEYETSTDASPLPSKNLEYLSLILKKCRDSGVELILVKTPISSWRYPWYEEWDGEIEDFANKNGVKYYNLLTSAEEIGIDPSFDSYDGGIHLNLRGAEKTTAYLGEILAREHNMKGNPTPRDEAVWREKLSIYYKERNE